jgi:hypothetical protein
MEIIQHHILEEALQGGWMFPIITEVLVVVVIQTGIMEDLVVDGILVLQAEDTAEDVLEVDITN